MSVCVSEMNPSRDELRRRLREYLNVKKQFRTEPKALFKTSDEHEMLEHCKGKRNELQMFKRIHPNSQILTSGLSISEL